MEQRSRPRISVVFPFGGVGWPRYTGRPSSDVTPSVGGRTHRVVSSVGNVCRKFPGRAARYDVGRRLYSGRSGSCRSGACEEGAAAGRGQHGQTGTADDAAGRVHGAVRAARARRSRVSAVRVLAPSSLAHVGAALRSRLPVNAGMHARTRLPLVRRRSGPAQGLPLASGRHHVRHVGVVRKDVSFVEQIVHSAAQITTHSCHQSLVLNSFGCNIIL